MSKFKGINVFSEIGKLRKVMVHRPGHELENLMPDLLDRLLFDDIPYLKIAREEHDAFAEIMRKNGAEVLYLEDLVADVLKNDEIKNNFIDEYLIEGSVSGKNQKKIAKEFLLSFKDTNDLVDKLMSGIRKDELVFPKANSLSEMVNKDYPFLVDPMPNLYFTRDPFSFIGNGVSINKMRNETRNRETLFAKYIFNHHEDFKHDLPKFYNREDKYAIEGGDILVMDKHTIAIGISRRTDSQAIELFAENLLNSETSFKKVLAFHIPNKRAFMHLDTVFTMIDKNICTVHPEIEGPLNVYSISKGINGLNIEEQVGNLEQILEKNLGIDKFKIIRCGGGNLVHAAREQWNDGSNTLAIAPGHALVYSRNDITNRLLEEAGVTLHIMPSSEVSRGRGGPRCMSMPIYREDI